MQLTEGSRGVKTAGLPGGARFFLKFIAARLSDPCLGKRTAASLVTNLLQLACKMGGNLTTGFAD